MKKMFIFLEMSLLVVLLSACATMVVNSDNSRLQKNGSYLVAVFKNFTETPHAGLRVSSMIDSIMASKGYKTYNTSEIFKSNGNNKNIDKLIRRAKRKDIEYVISGTVNEFRYKTGIEGEPAVGISIFVYNTSDEKLVWSSTGSATGWSNQSRTTILQNLINRLIDK